MASAQPGDVVFNSPLKVVLWLVICVFLNPFYVEIEHPPKPIWVKATRKLDCRSWDRGA